MVGIRQTIKRAYLGAILSCPLAPLNVCFGNEDAKSGQAGLISLVTTVVRLISKHNQLMDSQACAFKSCGFSKNRDPGCTQFLGEVTRTVATVKTLEELTRPLLSLLQITTGLDSTYLTHVDEAAGQQHVLYSLNARTMHIPEGLTVPWQDTLCRRAVSEGVTSTPDALGTWGDVEAARALGIRTYVTTPVRFDDGRLYGTLCAASTATAPVTEQTRTILDLFATLIQQQIEREQLLHELQQANSRLEEWSYRDPLTGLANRRFLMKELHRLFALADRTRQSVLIVYIDLDGFKAINDRFGHEAGDDFLKEFGSRLRQSMRAGDQLARIGGDEFVMIGLAPPDPSEHAHSMAKVTERLASGTTGQYRLGGAAILYSGPSIGIVIVEPGLSSPEEALHEADGAMYFQKSARRLAHAV